MAYTRSGQWMQTCSSYAEFQGKRAIWQKLVPKMVLILAILEAYAEPVEIEEVGEQAVRTYRSVFQTRIGTKMVPDLSLIY